MISLSPWLEARRRGGLAAGQGATSQQLCEGSGACGMRDTGPASQPWPRWDTVHGPACCTAGCLGSASASLPAFQTSPSTIQGHPRHLHTGCHWRVPGIFLACWRQSPSYSLESSAGQGLAVLSLHKSKLFSWILLFRPNSAPGLLLRFPLPPP